ncbi:MAG TPA: hypothetical protein VMW72_21935 [Sedimentisphaerales bacterium]|nr:hypothetical protein [Sedimentisphaerales bacterium]
MRAIVFQFTFVFLAVGVLGCTENIQPPEGGASFTNLGNPPTGRLGHPIGSYLTIEGHRDPRKNPSSYLIDMVNGAKLENPVRVWIENLKLPRPDPSVRCVISGYETFRWYGQPREVQLAEGWEEAQMTFQPGFFFRATSVKKPANLHVANEGG